MSLLVLLLTSRLQFEWQHHARWQDNFQRMTVRCENFEGFHSSDRFAPRSLITRLQIGNTTKPVLGVYFCRSIRRTTQSVSLRTSTRHGATTAGAKGVCSFSTTATLYLDMVRASVIRPPLDSHLLKAVTPGSPSIFLTVQSYTQPQSDL